ncbi:MAG: nuclear transport factor 2 family protein [Actinobacteria bacterium]|nr:nuclear transport factor 2 family protein [Actinomycetota bacterium]
MSEASGSGDIVRDFIRAFNDRDEETIVALMCEDAELLNPLGRVVATRATVREYLASNEREGIQIEHDGDMRIEGDWVIAPVRMHLSDGTTLPSAALYEIRDGRVAVMKPMMDRAAVGLDVD